MNRTIFIIIDGLRGDALEKVHAPTLSYLRENGASTMTMKTVNPSLTLPAHFSIFTSLAPYSHGVTANTALPDLSCAAQSLFPHVKSLGGTVSAFYSWDHLRNLCLPGVLDVAHCRTVSDEKDLLALAADASAHITTDQPDFCFVYFELTDIVGHRHGWMSEEYLQAVEVSDRALERLLDGVLAMRESERVNIVVQSDHGGKGDNHMGEDPEIMNVPFIAWGKGILENQEIASPVSILDTAPTLAGMMGIPPHFAWQGKTMNQIFNDGGSAHIFRAA